MNRISFAKDVGQLTKGADTLCVAAPAAVFKDKRRFPRLLHKNLTALLLELVKDLKPGALGTSAKTLYSGKPGKLIGAVLPDEGSRYNAPCRAEAVHKTLSGAGLASAKKKVAILVFLDDEAHQTGVLNAIGRVFPLLSLKSKDASGARVQVLLVDRAGEPVRVDATAREIMETARLAAQLVDTPPSDLTPEAFANAIVAELAGIEGVHIEQLVGDQLLEHKLGGIHAVGRCALSAPRMLIAKYHPDDAEGPHVALVGKGVTYDTGGLHIKPRGSMETMKGDMGGAAAVFGAFRVLAKSGVKRKLTLVCCLAENAIGPAAYKPDDVLIMHSGKTVEINNTDAEGRLLLADGVSYAARELGATIILDAATLTGAQLMATGMIHAAVMSNDADLEARVVASGRAVGDLVHPLPFAPEFFKSEFTSPLADMRNSVKNRMNAQSSCAGQFVYNHIEDAKVRWGHVDLAGPAFRNDRGTGYGVALLADVVRGL